MQASSIDDQTETSRPDEDWKVEISAFVRDLKDMKETSEKGFLSVGTQLRDVHATTKQVSERLASLLAGYSAEGSMNSLGELQTMSKRSTDQLNSVGEYSDKAVSRLHSLESPLLSLPASLKEFDRLVSRLRKMGIIAHIEAARLGNKGLEFVRLAEAVSTLGEQIAAKAKEARAYVGEVDEVIAINKTKMVEMSVKHRDVSLRVVADMKSNLQVLNEKQEMYQQTASGISIKSEEAIRNINIVVESVQYHDITRQQVDHIIDALENARQETSAIEVIPICEIQVAQLKRVGKEFENAILSITTALGDLSSSITMMLSESEQISDFTKESGSTFFEQVERGLEIVTATMLEDQFAVHDLIESLRQVSKNIHKMKSFLDEMVEVDSEIELLALNSRVKAAKTGEGGAALGVIAESIQHLSGDTLREVDKVIELVSDMVSASNDLADDRAIEDMLQQVESETNHIIGKLSESVKMFHDNNETSNKIFLDTESVCGAIYSQLEDLANQIRQHESFAVSLEETGAKLERFVARLRSSVPHSARTLIDRRLEDMRKKYTMETERYTHSAVVNGENPDRGLQSNGAGTVELF